MFSLEHFLTLNHKEQQWYLITTCRDALLKQGKRSTDGHICLYKDNEGNKCAVGHLIPDSLYTPEVEVGNIYDVISESYKRGSPLKKLKYLFPHKHLLGLLQDTHDYIDPQKWGEAFEDNFSQYNPSYKG